MTDVLNSTVLTGEPTEHAPSSDIQGLTTKSLSPRQMATRRFLSHKPAVVATLVLLAMVVFVLLAPITARYGVEEPVFQTTAEQSNRYLSPRAVAWFGTDEIGRDLYSRLIYGTRVSLGVGLAAALIAVIIGTAVGAFAGIRGGWFDDVLMRVTDIFLAFPLLVALLVTRNMLGQIDALEPIMGPITSLRFMVLLLALFGWMGVARVVRGQVLALKEREFIEASRAHGCVEPPHRAAPPAAELDRPDPRRPDVHRGRRRSSLESTLGFFGFGPQPGSGQTSLGLLVGSSKENVLSGNWWMVVFPCAVLLVLALSINMFGDGLRDATDPKMQRAVH